MRQSFRKYLECGIFAHGFALAWCDDCGDDYFFAVAFIHRFGSSLNGHVHFHVSVVHGMFEAVAGEGDADAASQASPSGVGFSADAGVCIESHDRAGLERLLRDKRGAKKMTS